MRVISGTARGRKLKEPADYTIRPTTDQVKESMFNICQFSVEGRRVLDLFGGTGQLGIEAASRGAAQVDIVDVSRDSIWLIRENASRSGLNVRVIQSDALDFLRACGAYDLIFLDPPYDTMLAENALQSIKLFDKLTIGGIILCETRANAVLPALEAPYRLGKEYRYGRVKLTTYLKGSTE